MNSSTVQGGARSPASTAPEVPPARIGEEVTRRRPTFVVTRLTCGEKLSDGDGDTRYTPRRAACVLDLTLRNHGTEPVVFAGAGQHLVDGAGKSYGVDVETTMLRAGPGAVEIRISARIRLLSPGTEAPEVLVFAPPEGTVPVAAELRGASMAPRTLLRGPDRGARVRLDVAPG